MLHEKFLVVTCYQVTFFGSIRVKFSYPNVLVVEVYEVLLLLVATFDTI